MEAVVCAATKLEGKPLQSGIHAATAPAQPKALLPRVAVGAEDARDTVAISSSLPSSVACLR